MTRSAWDTRTQRPIGWQIQIEDMNVLTALDAFGLLTWDQIRRYFYWSDRTAHRRLGYLLRAGLIAADRSLDNMYGRTYEITTRGCHALGLDRGALDTPKGPAQTHTLAIADLVLSMTKDGAPFLTDRHLKAAVKGDSDYTEYDAAREIIPEYDTPWWRDKDENAHFVATPMPNGRTHIPDAVIPFKDQLCAVEIELATKSEARIREILRSYLKRNAPYGRVIWCTTPPVWKLLEKVMVDEDMAPRGDAFEQVANLNYTKTNEHPRWGTHCVYTFQPDDDGLDYALEQRLHPAQMRGVTRAQHVAQRRAERWEQQRQAQEAEQRRLAAEEAERRRQEEEEAARRREEFEEACRRFEEYGPPFSHHDT